MYGTPAFAAASTIRSCGSPSAVLCSAITRNCCPPNTRAKEVVSSKSTRTTLTPVGGVALLSTRVMAVMLCFPVLRSSSVRYPPIRPVAWKLLGFREGASGIVGAYADDGNVFERCSGHCGRELSMVEWMWEIVQSHRFEGTLLYMSTLYPSSERQRTLRLQVGGYRPYNYASQECILGSQQGSFGF